MVSKKYPYHLILIAFITLICLSISGNVRASVLTVNSTNDANDGGCNASHCSLREAIIAANANADVDTIAFNIPAPYIIRPLSALPIITSPVVIDGTTEPDYVGSPIVVLDGLLAGTYEIQGLHITAGNSTVKGLVIHRFSANGIYIRQNGGNIIEGNYIGLDVAGTATMPNGQDGINIFGSPNNRVGGTTAQQRNVISGNNYFGVVVGSFDSTASGNLVQGNYIGTDKNGTTPNFGNRLGGVAVSGTNNTIGGTVVGSRNVISGNGSYGVYMNSGTNNRVQGNYIGVDVSGAVALGNSKYGVEMMGTGLILGGDTPGSGNVISGNGTEITSAGVHILTAGNTVVGNYIGTNAAGTSAIPNNVFGVLISNAASNTIGGTTTAARNVISGNSETGIYISNAGARENVILGNYIGTNAAGNSALPNGDDGITIFNAHSNVIGGTVAGSGNIISGNGVRGVGIDGINSALNRLEGNFIGTKADGLTALGNGSYGVQLSRSTGDNTIGGTQTGAGNTIAFNGADGIFIDSIDIDSYGNAILTNRIYSNGQLGIDLSPNNANPNDAGDADGGMNFMQNFPTITQAISYATTVNIAGTLNSASNTLFRLEFFANSTCDASGYGEGQYYLGSTNATTDGSGNASFSVTFPGVFDLGAPITATATDSGNNTSEFSPCTGLTEITQTGPGFIVTRFNDNNGTCGTHDCSLREAINAANELPDTTTITFNIPGGGVQTIQPTTPLPVITSPVIIDGTTQPGFAVGAPVIVLNGANAVTSTVPPDPPIDLVGINIVGVSNSTVRGLVLNGWNYGGVGILNGNNNIIEGNFIGTNVAGTAAVPNLYGVIIYNGSNNRVGGTTPAQRNVISGNNDDGVNIGGQTSAQAVANVVQGNYIGTNAAGTTALGNGDDGVKVEIADGTIIGGTVPGAGNVIAASNNNGVILKGANTVNSLVQGNFIGTDVTGTVDLGNDLNGVRIEGAPNNTIGGMVVAARNLISGNENGIVIINATATDNLVQGNYIGTNAAGTATLGNTNYGVVVSVGAFSNTIGGTAAGAGNLISGNNPSAESLSGAGVGIAGNANVVQGNKIGTDVTGTLPLGNGFAGIWIENATNSIIGGIGGAPNVIAFNSGDGIYFRFTNGTPTGNQITTNSIFSNTDLGIDLGNTNGVTTNDPGDTDTGANNLQNFPVLTSALASPDVVYLRGTLNSTPNTTFRIEFFANPTCDSSGNGEGALYLGADSVTTNGAGTVSFITPLGAVVPVGHAITATATDVNGNTSEFSACLTTLVGPPSSAPAAAPDRNYFTTPSVPLTWNGVSWAVGYEIEVDSDANFAAPYVYTNRVLGASAQSDTVTLPSEDRVYYWRVGAKKAEGGIVWSAPQTFTVDVP